MTTKSKAKAASAKDGTAETLEAINTIANEAVDAAISMGSDSAAEGYKNASEFGKESLDAAKDGYDTFAANGKDNFDAYSSATSAAFSGFEALYGQVMAYTKMATAENTDIVQKFFGAKTPQEIMDVQAEAVNNTVNRVIAQSSALNDITAEMMSQSMAPIKAQFETSVEKFANPFAG